jgi:predicted O-methyltransferase YrrM
LIKTVPTFEEAYEQCKHIVSAVSEHEAARLYRYAHLCPDNLPILEIGSDKGFSTVLLAQTGRQVIAVDFHRNAIYTDPETGARGGHDEDDYRQFIVNKKPYKNIRYIRKKSTDVKLSIIGPIGFLFIDANHAWPHPKKDFLHFAPMLKPDTFVAWHDCKIFPSVDRSINQLIEEGKIEKVDEIGILAITKVL